MKSSSSILIAAATTTTCSQAFVITPSRMSSPSSLNMGLFDGVKEAFGAADGMGELDGDRETPIDRWMGWNAKTEDSTKAESISKAPTDFIDSMDTENYVTTTLSKPMGIVFEENDSDLGGIFVLEITEGSSAESDGTIRPGDQLVSVGETKVTGLQFEDALGTIIDSKDDKVKLNFFRGPAKFLYGPAGASQEWLDDFIKEEKKVEASA